MALPSGGKPNNEKKEGGYYGGGGKSYLKSGGWIIAGFICLIIAAALFVGAAAAGDSDLQYIAKSWLAFFGVVFLLIMAYCFYKAYKSGREGVKKQYGK